MSDDQIIRLCASEAAAAVIAGELDERELYGAYHRRSREHSQQNTVPP